MKKETFKQWSDWWIEGFGITQPSFQKTYYEYLKNCGIKTTPNMLDKDIHKMIVQRTGEFLHVFRIELINKMFSK
jgi:hypothetical protein